MGVVQAHDRDVPLARPRSWKLRVEDHLFPRPVTLPKSSARAVWAHGLALQSDVIDQKPSDVAAEVALPITLPVTSIEVSTPPSFHLTFLQSVFHSGTISTCAYYIQPEQWCAVYVQHTRRIMLPNPHAVEPSTAIVVLKLLILELLSKPDRKRD